MAKTSGRRERRQGVHTRVRKKVRGTAERPRLAFFKSSRHIYGQLIDDDSGKTLAAASSVSKTLRGSVPKSANIEAAKAVGAALAEQAAANDIQQAVFDRGGFLYHGAVKAFADAAREKGLKC